MQAIVRDSEGRATLTRRCEECPETLTMVDGVPMTEELAIQLGMWRTVIVETVIPQGIRVDSQYFCSTDCHKKSVDKEWHELHDAEDKILMAMENKKTSRIINPFDREE